jgi:hypothetical protein
MAGARVRWRRSDQDFEVLDYGRMWFTDQTTIAAAAEVIEPASLTELHHAVDRCRRDMYDDDYFFEIYDAPIEQLSRDEEAFGPLPVSLKFSDAYTILNLVLVHDPGEPAQDGREVAALLSPLLFRMRATFLDFTVYTEIAVAVCRASVSINSRNLTVGEALRIGSELLLLWEASLGSGLTPATAADLVRAGRADLLIGQFESEWFEVKEAPYGLGDPLQEIELAKDVSALANRVEGGLLVIGLVTARRGERDVVSRVRTQPMARLKPLRYRQGLDRWIYRQGLDRWIYRQGLDRWIYPRLQDVVVEAVEVEPDRGLLMVLIPPQPQPLLPFLVAGAVVGKKVLGSHFSLVRRRGDETVADTAAVAHGLMVAGRAALASAPRQGSLEREADDGKLPRREPCRRHAARRRGASSGASPAED